MSLRTEESYVQWVRRFVLFHGKRHPSEMGAPEVEAFLTSLAVEGNVAASTQNQARSALWNLEEADGFLSSVRLRASHSPQLMISPFESGSARQ